MFWFVTSVVSVITFLLIRKLVLLDRQQQTVLHELNKASNDLDNSLYAGNSRLPND